MAGVRIKEELLDEVRSGYDVEPSRAAPPPPSPPPPPQEWQQQQHLSALARADGSTHGGSVWSGNAPLVAAASTRPSGGLASLAAAVAQAEAAAARAAAAAGLKRPRRGDAPTPPSPSLPPAQATAHDAGNSHEGAGVGLVLEPNVPRVEQQERQQQPSPLPVASGGSAAVAAAGDAGTSASGHTVAAAKGAQDPSARAPASASASAFATGPSAPLDTSARQAEQHAAVGAEIPPHPLRVTDVEVARLGEVLAAIEAAGRAGGRMPIVLLQTVGQGGSGGGDRASVGAPLPPPPAAGTARALYQLSDGSLRLGGELPEELLGDGGGGGHGVTVPAHLPEQQQRRRQQQQRRADASNVEGGVGSEDVARGAGIATEPCGDAAGEDAVGTGPGDGCAAAVPVAAGADANGAGRTAAVRCAPDAPSKCGDRATAADVRQAAPAPDAACPQLAMMAPQRLHEAAQPRPPPQQQQRQQQQQLELAAALTPTAALEGVRAPVPRPGARLDRRPNSPAVPQRLAGGRGAGGPPPPGPEGRSTNPGPAAAPAGRTVPGSGAAAGAIAQPAVLVAADGRHSAPQPQHRNPVSQGTTSTNIGGTGGSVGGGGRAPAACVSRAGRGGPVLAAGGTAGGGPGPYITICVPPAAAEALLREAAARAVVGGGQPNPFRELGDGSGGSVSAARAMLPSHRMVLPGRQADCAAPTGTAGPEELPRGGRETGDGNAPRGTADVIKDGDNGASATQSAGPRPRLARAGTVRSGSMPRHVPQGVPLAQLQPPREPPPRPEPLLQPPSSSQPQQQAASCHSVGSGTHTLGDVVPSGSDVSSGSGAAGGGGGGGASEAHSPQAALTRLEAAQSAT